MADVAYDLFTSATSGGSNAYEIMIWMANYNAGPISYTYSSSGAPTPIATVTIASRTWSLYYGSNGSNLVYSFLPPANTTITSFSADLKLFLQVRSPFSQLDSISECILTVPYVPVPHHVPRPLVVAIPHNRSSWYRANVRHERYSHHVCFHLLLRQGNALVN